ncbi:conserved hypothetical protein [Streptomyces clavuligerus]|uniref:Putative Tra3-like protein n=1 Tax=Streptomyces clavuligerus TaxID=1901 RepID=Q6TMR4_STRCL|nr:putative Tra3-like protein [Streptomyces clavuligerus]EDY48727.1 conserved hypothetical protein [Streptomyces clavuligerus]
MSGSMSTRFRGNPPASWTAQTVTEPSFSRGTTTVVRRDGREPLGLGAAIGMMMTERGLAAPSTGGEAVAGVRGARERVGKWLRPGFRVRGSRSPWWWCTESRGQ